MSFLDRIEKIEYNSGTGGAYEARYGYTYDGNGRLSLVTDYKTGEVTHFVYDSAGRITRTVVYDSAEYKNLYGASVMYDEQSRVSYIDHTFDYSVNSSFANATVTYGYTYGETNGLISAMSISAGTLTGSISPVYDSFGRLSTKTTAFTVSSTSAFYNKHTYAYVTSGTRTSVRVSQYKSEVGVSSSSTTATTYNYTYDANGNITQITNASGVVQNKYYYDALGQLTREDNLAKNKTYVWTYDNAGNRTSQKTYAYTTGTLGTVQSTQSYTYGNSTWGDLLTYTGGYYVEYDGIGNPTKIYQDDGGYQYGYLLTWEGRKLVSYSEFDDYGDGAEIYSTISYTYNDEGIRTSKNVNGTEHTYLLNGSQIIAELWSTHMLVYVYDEAGTPIGIKYRSTSYAEGVFDSYFFEKNLQGDIVAIYNASGTKIGTYSYDAWGNITQSTLSTNTVDRFIVSNNPFRYRGYYYDTDTTLYYLQSRYYKASWGRFLNADAYINANGDILGYNMFAYCGNNPQNQWDPSGEATNSISLTLSFGFFGAGYSFSIGMATDSEGMVAFQWTYSVPKDEKTRNTELGINIGAGVSFAQTDLESVDDLNGKSKSAGIAAGPLSGDIIKDQYNNNIGYGVGIGAGLSYSAHVNETYTGTIGRSFKSLMRFFKDLIL